MRAAVGCVVLALCCLGASGSARGALPKREASCEEQCQLDAERGESDCEEQGFAASDRDACRETVRARLAVCLRICDE